MPRLRYEVEKRVFWCSCIANVSLIDNVAENFSAQMTSVSKLLRLLLYQETALDKEKSVDGLLTSRN